MRRRVRKAGPSTDELVNRYQAGETLAAIAATSGLRLAAVHTRLKSAGVKLRPRGRRPSRGALGVSDGDLVARYQAGETCAVIAAATGLTEAVVRHRLKRAGVEMRRGGVPQGHGRLELPIAQIIERYRAGESTYAIGRSLGVSGQSVRERLIEVGVERRPAGTHRRPLPQADERPAATVRGGAKRRLIEEFLRRPEAQVMTQREIAEACGVAQSHVSRTTRRLRAADHGT